MPVSIRIRNVTTLIEGSLSVEVRNEIRKTLSYIIPGYKFTPAYKYAVQAGRKWDGSKTVALLNKGGVPGLTIPTGLASYAREILAAKGVPYEISDERLVTVPDPGWSTSGLIMRDYQLPIVESALKKQRGVIKASTGSGKTEVVVKIMVEVACFPAIFYVTSCDLLLQAKDRFSRYVTHNGLPAKIGQIGAGVCDIQPITIATVQSCERVLTGKYTKYTYDDYSSDDKTEFSDPQKNAIREMVKDAKFVVFDECQHCSCETIQSILNESHSARFRFGCSASPWRDDGLDLLIEACFGRRVCDVTASFLINSGYLLRPFITFNHFNQSLGDFGTFNAHYEAFVSDNVARNQWIAERANYHVSQGRPTIVLVKWVKHAEKLQPMIPGSEILCSSGDSKKSPKKRKEFMDAMRERKLMCIIGTSLMDEGVDVPAAGAGIFAGGGKSSTRELQRVGRFIRPDPADPDKKCAYIEEFYDHSKWLRNHAKLRRKILETEPAFEISDNNISLSL